MAFSFAIVALLAAGHPGASPDAETLIRQVIASQKRAERSMPPHTYDLEAVETAYGKDGRAKSVQRKVYAVSSDGAGAENVRELVSVNGRPATPDEKRDSAIEEAKSRRRRIDRRAAMEASRGAPRVSGEEDDPSVGPRRLSEVLALYDYRLEGQDVHDGRRCWVLTFHPKPGAKTRTVGDRALAALEGRVLVDAEDLQVSAATAHLVKPVRVAGGLAANVGYGTVAFEGVPVGGGYWMPRTIDLHLKGTTALLFRMDKGWEYRITGFRRFAVSIETAIAHGAR